MLILLFHLVSHIVLLGDVTPIVDLEAESAVNELEYSLEPGSPCHLQPLAAHTLDLHLGFPSGSVMVPPYSTGIWSGLTYFSKTSFQFPGKGRMERERRVTTRQDFITALVVYTEEARKKPICPAHRTQALGAYDHAHRFRRTHHPLPGPGIGTWGSVPIALAS